MLRVPPGGSVKIVRGLTVATLVAPVIVFVAALLTGAGVMDWRIGYGILTVQIAWYAAMLGGLAALGAVALCLKDIKRAGPFALAAVLFAGVTLAVFVRHFMVMGYGAPEPDASTNPMDPPGYSRQIMVLRTASDAVPVDHWQGIPSGCDLGGSLPTQVAPGAAAWALERAGFTVRGVGVARADGYQESFWFGFTHDATIRIRPGQTDIRVTAREDRRDGGEACRLAKRIKIALQTSR